jgi:hypothetical protein
MNDVDNTTVGPESRREYRKPELRRVQLVTGEILAVGCKLSNGGKNVGMDSISCTIPNGCVNAGS